MSNNMLKSVSNQSLLEMYMDYKNRIDRYIHVRTGCAVGSDAYKYWDEKVSDETEWFLQIEREILARMSGMEID